MAGKLVCFRILVGEDDWLLADVLVNLVRLHDGVVVGPVSNEDEAREILSREPVDAAILDVVLASGPCLPLVDELRKRNIPVVLTTGYALSQIPDEYSALPIFSKPFHIGTLVDCLAEQCRAASKGQEQAAS